MQILILAVMMTLNMGPLWASHLLSPEEIDPHHFANALRTSKPFQVITPQESQFIQKDLKSCLENREQAVTYTRTGGPVTYRVESVVGSEDNLTKVKRWRSTSLTESALLLEFKGEGQEENLLAIKLVAVESDLS